MSPNPAADATMAPADRIPREIWVLIGAAFIIAVGFGLITPVLPQFARSFDVGVTAASVVVSAFAFFRLVFAPVGGRLVTTLGERPVYLTGLIIVALSTGVFGKAKACRSSTSTAYARPDGSRSSNAAASWVM